jgi:hypothetical protein
MSDIITWDYPKKHHDENGYPTSEALDYIRNWTVIYEQLSTKFGSEFGKGHYDELIEYIKSIWWYNDAIVYEDGLLELHTCGWSGNEDIVAELKNTDLWMLKFRAQTAGGHYYFKLDSDSEYDWDIVKSKDK